MANDNALLPPTIHLGYLPDYTVLEYLARAKESIRFVCPGFSKDVAQCLSERWKDLGANAVEIVLDVDSDLCRLGFCDGEALVLVMETASLLHTSVYRQDGLRLCVLEIDGERIVFAPTPRLVEESDIPGSEILLAPCQGAPLHEQILSPPESAPCPLTEDAVKAVTSDLEKSPAEPFDLARQVRVLSTRFQFVEFGLQNAALSRKRAPVPPDLLGLAPGADDATQDLLRASFQLVANGDAISGEKLMKCRGDIEKLYTVSLGEYGRIIKQDNRPAFDQAVAELKTAVATFQKDAEAKLDDAIKKNCDAVVERLFPIVRVNLPMRWIASLGPQPSDEAIRTRLAKDLEKSFGGAKSHLGEIKVRLIYKDITAAMLKDADFKKAALKQDLDLDRLYEEYQAARTRN
jgi:hypothetical protein